MELCGNHASRIRCRGEAAFPPAIVAFVMSRSLLSARPSACFENTCFNLNSRRYPVLACPKTMLVFSNRCWKWGGGGRCGWGGLGLVDFCPDPIAHPDSSHTVLLFNMLETLRDWLFSARRAGMEGRVEWRGCGGGLDGSQFIVSPESTTDRAPVSSPPAQTDLERGRAANTINPPAPTPRSASKGGGEEARIKRNADSVVPLNTRVLGLKSLPRCAAVTDHASDCQSSGKVAAFKRSRGCWGRGILVLGLVFLSDQRTCAPPPFPHPDLSLYYYRLRGAQ